MFIVNFNLSVPVGSKLFTAKMSPNSSINARNFSCCSGVIAGLVKLIFNSSLVCLITGSEVGELL